LANAFVNRYSGSSFFIGFAAFGALGFSFLVVGLREVPIVEVSGNNLVHI
jgi:hypothetical protein